jgi:hypothetical protein
LTQYPWFKYDSRINEIEIWDDTDDCYFYQNGEEIFIEYDGCDLIVKEIKR